jgi:hypothetical protein
LLLAGSAGIPAGTSQPRLPGRQAGLETGATSVGLGREIGVTSVGPGLENGGTGAKLLLAGSAGIPAGSLQPRLPGRRAGLETSVTSVGPVWRTGGTEAKLLPAGSAGIPAGTS